jgi:hypothetical protein
MLRPIEGHMAFFAFGEQRTALYIRMDVYTTNRYQRQDIILLSRMKTKSAQCAAFCLRRSGVEGGDIMRINMQISGVLVNPAYRQEGFRKL